MMRNFFGGLIIAYGFQKVAWSTLDFGGLKHYGSEGWPYTLNPVGGGIVAVIALAVGLAVLEKKYSASSFAAIGLAVFAGFHFWLVRRPANPYTDYGEDNFFRMFINLILIAIVLFLICGIESLVRHKGDSDRLTEQASEPDS